jgi:hypothetical protein
MSQHFLRYVRDENWFLFLKHLRRRANPRDPGPGFDWGRVWFSIELQNLETFSVACQNPEVGSMEGASVGQNATEAVQERSYRGLIGHCAGHVQQNPISVSVSGYHVRNRVLIGKRVRWLHSIHLTMNRTNTAICEPSRSAQPVPRADIKTSVTHGRTSIGINKRLAADNFEGLQCSAVSGFYCMFAHPEQQGDLPRPAVSDAAQNKHKTTDGVQSKSNHIGFPYHEFKSGADRGLPRPWPKPFLILAILPLCEGAGVNHTGRRHHFIPSQKSGKPRQLFAMFGKSGGNLIRGC